MFRECVDSKNTAILCPRMPDPNFVTKSEQNSDSEYRHPPQNTKGASIGRAFLIFYALFLEQQIEHSKAAKFENLFS